MQCGGCCYRLFFFFFKQKTAYEMRISDWSSYVCSSDLPIAGAVGAEIHGVDLSQELGSETVATIRRALLDHLVIFFRDQDLTPAQFLAFAQCFGTPVEYPFVKGIDGFPEITEVIKREHEHHNFGGVWHSDTDYLR